MSARQWKIRLEECQAKLGEATLAAKEWREVAENRLILIRRLDKTLSHNLEDLVKVGEVFGVEVNLGDGVWTPTAGMEGGAVVMYIMGKLEAVAEYQARLLREASAIQVTLNDTYELACAAVSVSRPSMDLTLPEETQQVSEPSSPYREFETDTNNLPETDYQKHDSAHGVVVPRPMVKDASDAEKALALFRQ
jgi:hypothetical protein